jgi:hypothetical protein
VAEAETQGTLQIGPLITGSLSARPYSPLVTPAVWMKIHELSGGLQTK